jgi:hypothetical protein
MLTTYEPRTVETFGTQETSAFTIKANGKAFKVLIDGLYSNKILAVIRELWSNAYDSHIAAGTPEVPFECQLPTAWDPQFRVRDFGTSLSHDGVMRLYTTVFESTKDGSNDQVGKLGLGSKSPFAYTDTFTVTAWMNGEKRLYSAYIGEDYVPRISFMGAEPSDEPQGLEISFPCAVSDCGAFAENAHLVARGFDVLPIIQGPELMIRQPEMFLTGPGWRLNKNGHRAYAKQGCVVYPIDPHAIPKATDDQRKILAAPLFIEFPVGDLEIAASREGLGYNAPTCANILAAADRIANEVRDAYAARINSCTSYGEALRVYAQINEGASDAVRTILGRGMTWRGRKLRLQVDLTELTSRARTAGKFALCLLSDSKLTHWRKKNIKFEQHLYGAKLSATRTLIFFEDTTSKVVSNVGARIRHAYQTMRGIDYSGIVWVKADPNSHDFKRFFALMGRPKMIDAKALEKPPHLVQRALKRKVPLRVLPSRGEKWEDEIQVNEEDEVIYVELEKGDVTRGSASSLRSAREALIKLGYLDADTNIVGVPKSRSSVLARNPHWISMWQLIDECALEEYDARKVQKYNLAQVVHYGRVDDIVKFTDELAKGLKLKGALRRIHRVVSAARAYREANSTVPAIETLWRVSKHNVGCAPITFKLDLSRAVKAVEKQYPLLEVVLRNAHVNSEVAKALRDYVTLVDAREEKHQNVISLAAKAA